jgi:hypothetical protein
MVALVLAVALVAVQLAEMVVLVVAVALVTV